MWFKRKKNTENNSVKKPIITPLKPLAYPPKIILAWAKAIEGNKEITKWLSENGYHELVIAAAAIALDDEARNWLMKNGYPHIMAMINAAEGIESAQNWLKSNKFELLYHIAMAVEDEKESWLWIKNNSTIDIFMLTQTIKKIKDKIDENHNDIHSFNKDI